MTSIRTNWQPGGPDLEQLGVDQVRGRDRAQLEQLDEHTNRNTNTNRLGNLAGAGEDPLQLQHLVDLMRGQHVGSRPAARADDQGGAGSAGDRVSTRPTEHLPALPLGLRTDSLREPARPVTRVNP